MEYHLESFFFSIKIKLLLVVILHDLWCQQKFVSCKKHKISKYFYSHVPKSTFSISLAFALSTLAWSHLWSTVMLSSVRPKPGFGIRNRNQGPLSVSVSEPKLFFRNHFFFNFSKQLSFCAKHISVTSLVEHSAHCRLRL